MFYANIRAEKAAGEEINEIGYQTFVPMETHRNKRPSALFPRYGFVRFDINHPGWGEIIDTKGVIDLIRMNRIPRAVPEAVISGLQLADQMGLFDHTKPPKVGTMVEIMDGHPFANEIGRICNIPKNRRARVLLKVMGGERIVSVPLPALREAGY